MRKTAGELIYRFRMERELEAQQICEGICSSSSMSYYERDKRSLDNLLFERLVERMGISPEEFTLMVTEEEYIYRMWQEKVYACIQNAEWKKLIELLQKDIKGKKWINEKLQMQFYHYANGIYYGSQYKYEKAVEELQKALEKTIPDGMIQNKSVLLATMELHMLMLYLFYCHKAKIICDDVGKKLFWFLESFIYDGILDINEKAKVYPKLVCIGFNILGKLFTEEEKIELCEKSIHILRKNKTFHDITEVFRWYIPLLEKSRSKKLDFYKKQYEVFCELLQEEQIDIGFRPEVLIVRKAKVYMIHEYLSSKREQKLITQEKLSEGICAAETYSRLERGERAPSRNNLKALTDKLEINWVYYRGEIESCSLKAYELRRKERQADIEGRWNDSLELIKELEQCLDMSIVENYQYVKLSEYVTKCRLGFINKEEACVKLKELLSMTRNMTPDSSKLVYYSKIEMEIVAHMAQLYRNIGKYQEGIVLIETIIKQMKNSRLEYEDQWGGFDLLFRVLASLYFAIGEYDISIQISKYVKSIMLKRRTGANLPVVLDEIADDLEHKGEQYSEEYKKLYRYTYYIADFYRIVDAISIAKNYYEENFDSNMKWYN